MQLVRWVWTMAFLSVTLIGAVTLRAADEAKKPQSPPTKEEEYYELMKLLADTFEQVERNYVKEVDRRALVEAAVRGILEELDPYSNYISPDDKARFEAQVEQEFGGIGIQVAIDPTTHRLTVMTPLPGTPAYKAGVRAGDTVMEIEGKSTEKVTIEQAVKMLKGKVGEAVTISVQHAGSTTIEQLTMVRALIHLATVLGDAHKSDDSWNFMLDNEKKIGYLRLTAFGRDSTRELKEALTTLKNDGMKALILDLRFNPGGLLTAATEVSDLFLEEGKIVSTQGRNTPEKVFNATKKDTFSGFPMAVLVNHYSASASEIVSAALQDHKRAAIIGERTWGKGSVQNVIPLENDKSALKLTTASYHRPSGKNIHRFPGAKESDEWGVTPDESYTVQFTNEDMQKYLEYRRQRDVLSKDGPPKSDYVDRQLNKAVEYVVGQLSGETKTADKGDAKKTDDKPADKPATKPTDKGTEKATDKATDKPQADKPAGEKPAADKPAADKPAKEATPEKKTDGKSAPAKSKEAARVEALRELLKPRPLPLYLPADAG